MSEKCNKCNCINCGKINKYAFLILIEAGLNIGLNLVIMESKSSYYPIIFPGIAQIVMSLGSVLSFILIIIYKIRNKRKNNTINMLLVRKDTTNERSWKKKILWLLLVPLFNSIFIFIDGFIANNGVSFLNIYAFYFIYLSLFSNLLLKIKLYKHHYVCIIIIIILDLVNNMIYKVSIIQPFPASKFSYLPIIFSLLFYCLLLVYYKYLMITKYITTYEILFFEGSFSFVLLTITFIILLKIEYAPYFWAYYENIDRKEIIVLIIIAFIGFIFGLLKLIIIDIYSPFHILLTDLIPRNLSTIFLPTDTVTYITTITFTVIYVFILSIFVEFIELNFLGLSTMTKRNIENRARLESMEDDINDMTIEKKLSFDGYEVELEMKNE